MAVDSRLKRASIAGLALPFLLGVTNDATKPQAWRQTVANSYAGIEADEPALNVTNAPFIGLAHIEPIVGIAAIEPLIGITEV